MKTNRRTLLMGAAALGLAAPFIRPGAARAAEFTYKLANNQPMTHPTNIRAAEAVAKILEESDGRVDIQVFPSNQLGADTDVLGQLRSGGVEFFLLSPLILSTLIPNAAVNGVGFAFPDYDAVWSAMDGELGAYARSQIEAGGLIVQEKIWDNGFRQTTSSRGPITTPADFEGMRKAGRLAAECLDMLEGEVRAGVPTSHIDQLVFDFAMEHKATPATLMYRGYRKSTCTSVNHVVCHGSALGCYFFDPEGNRTEVFWLTGYPCWVPAAEPIDLEWSDEELMAVVRQVIDREASVPMGGLKPELAPAR